MERINKENKQIAERLADCYAGKTMHSLPRRSHEHSHSLSRLPNITQNKVVAEQDDGELWLFSFTLFWWIHI